MSTTAVSGPQYALPPNVRTAAAEKSRRFAVERWQVLAVVVLVAVGYVLWHLGRGWVPHDDGALAQSAERVLQGQLPHRDYDEIYTGGLAYLDAAAFRLLGTTLWSLRTTLLVFFAAWVPAVFYAASRFVGPLAAGAVTLLAVAWSVPNYPAAMPSWYNLFFATFAAASLLRYVETRRGRWLVAAGAAAGFSFLIKVIGLYVVAAALLFFVFEAHAQARAAHPDGRRGPAYSSFVTLSLLAFVVVLARLINNQAFVEEYVHFVLPGAALAALLITNEWHRPAGASRDRFLGFARLFGPFLLGFVIPIAIYLIPYAAAGALGAFVNGVFVLPTKRFNTAVWRVFPLVTVITLLPLVALTLLARYRRWAGSAPALIAAGVAGAAIVVATETHWLLYRWVFLSVRMLLPILLFAGVIVLRRERAADAGDPLLRSRTMILLAITALCSLVQFPFAAPIYFCYVAPLGALLAAALVGYLRPKAPGLPFVALAFYTAFAVVRVNTTMIHTMGVAFHAYPETVPLPSERAGITIQTSAAREYRDLLALLKQHARGGYTWASPDCPQVYYLSGLKNPTRALFDFMADTTDYNRRILTALDTAQVTAIVLNMRNEFSSGINASLFSELEKRYPRAREVGRFHVRWRT